MGENIGIGETKEDMAFWVTINDLVSFL